MEITYSDFKTLSSLREYILWATKINSVKVLRTETAVKVTVFDGVDTIFRWTKEGGDLKQLEQDAIDFMMQEGYSSITGEDTSESIKHARRKIDL